MDRYRDDVLRPGWQRAHLKKTRDIPVEKDLVVEFDDFCGAVVGWENGIVVLEDRRGKKRSFPFGPGFLPEEEPVAIRPPPRATAPKPRYTASGSRISETPEPARVALPPRIYVEGRHDAEPVEKVWGDDLRHVEVVMEYLGGIDDLPVIIAEFSPGLGCRLGVLADHPVAGSKESRIAKQVTRAGYRDYVFITGHEFIDIWHATKPERIGRRAWPQVPRDQDFKKGTLKTLGLLHADQVDIVRAWWAMLARVRTWRDLEPQPNRRMELLIDSIMQDHFDLGQCSPMDTAATLELIKEIAEGVINPRSRALEQVDVEAKTSPGDLVTIADREAEAFLSSASRRIYPGALVIGEEAVFANPELRRKPPGAEHAFVIDPISGTRNFIEGRQEYGVMLAEIRNGVTTRGWTWQPRTGRGYVTEKGAGVYLNDEPITPKRHDRPPLGASSKTHVQGFTGDGELSPVVRSLFICVFDYSRVLHGELDFIHCTKVISWDHLAGSLMAAESGGVSGTMDGADYTVANEASGLLVACDPGVWETVHRCLAGMFG